MLFTDMKPNTTIRPGEVHSHIGRHVLADGFPFVLDMKKSHGAYLHDAVTGKEYLDFFTGFASLPLGYNHPKMLNDIEFREELLEAALIHPANADVYTESFAKFVSTFGRVGIPDYLPHAFFISGGALAVENAMKVAMDWKVQKNFEKQFTREKGFKVIHFEQAFHGRSGYTLTVTNTQPNKTKWFAKFPDWPRIVNPKIKFPQTPESVANLIQIEQQAIAQIKQAFLDYPDDICAILIEPIQGEGGDNHFRQEFLESLRILCDENEALLIYDEVQTGVAMTGRFWAHQHFGENARPDLLAFGKKMQICGILGGPKVDEVETNCFAVSSRINSTWGGHLSDMVRSRKILEIIEEDRLVQNAASSGNYLLSALEVIEKEYEFVSNVRGRGLFCAVDLLHSDQVQSVIQEAYSEGLLILPCGERSIRFRPMLQIQENHIEEMIKILKRVLDKQK